MTDNETIMITETERKQIIETPSSYLVFTGKQDENGERLFEWWGTTRVFDGENWVMIEEDE